MIARKLSSLRCNADYFTFSGMGFRCKPPDERRPQRQETGGDKFLQERQRQSLVVGLGLRYSGLFPPQHHSHDRQEQLPQKAPLGKGRALLGQ